MYQTETRTPLPLCMGYKRSAEHIKSQLRIEFHLLVQEWKWLTLGFAMQIVHSTFTNLVYYFENKYMTGAQRMPLYDLGFDLFPTITGFWWLFSDLLIYTMLAFVTGLMAMSLLVSLKTENERPIYAVFALKRYMKTLVVLQTLRVLSFSFTLLPGSSTQCLYAPDSEQLSSPLSEFLEGPASSAGDSPDWDPPQTWEEIVFRIDPSTGCGDLMFSSHTIFAVLSVMATWDYFPFPGTKGFITACLVILVPFTLASRKHYTVDVFTSLYVVPCVYELIRLKFPDPDTVQDFSDLYGVRFSQDADPLCYSATIRKERFPVHMDQLPRDFEPRRHTFSGPGSGLGKASRERGDCDGGGDEKYKTVRMESDSPPPRHHEGNNVLTERGREAGMGV
ncbi:hypothetical protein TrRE_jg9244 [Triparma retinervis]|uniref:Sphingomyelin synthase-like domain-containing protein n=1 Tax=Triparma retinervis TaxID=2557542 RepID=A0A9W7ECI1_9STRA|nr:hypothetical protein TrRE_jg9244 [Triparma retinervis]